MIQRALHHTMRKKIREEGLILYIQYIGMHMRWAEPAFWTNVDLTSDFWGLNITFFSPCAAYLQSYSQSSIVSCFAAGVVHQGINL